MGLKDIKHQGYVAQFDKPRKLSYDLNALATIEELSGGKNIFELLQKFQSVEKASQGISFKDIRILLYAGLKSEDPNITIEEAGKLAGLSSISDVVNVIVNAFGVSMPEVKDKKK